MTDTRTHLSPMERLDFATPCLWPKRLSPDRTQCDLPARWLARSACCGAPVVFCDYHRREVLASHRLNRCPKCNKRGIPLNEAFIWEPLS